MRTVIFIPISRPDHLGRLFAALELMQCDAEATAILTYVDGDAALFVQARNFTEGSKFAFRLCVHRQPDAEDRSHSKTSIEGRRLRISAIHNEVRDLILECDYVFGLEDDTIPPTDALRRLLADYASHPHAGFIEGVELGRWSVPYVGAWRADDVYEPTQIESLMPSDASAAGHIAAMGKQLLEPIDAGGFYCYLTKREHFVGHTYEPFDGNSLGPDVTFGLWLRRQGYQNYIDWSLIVEHRTKVMGQAKSLTVLNTEPQQVVLRRDDSGWNLIR